MHAGTDPIALKDTGRASWLDITKVIQQYNSRFGGFFAVDKRRFVFPFLYVRAIYIKGWVGCDIYSMIYSDHS